MFSKILLALSPIVSAMAPVCSSSLPPNLTVFASMMNKDSLRNLEIPESEGKKVDPESIAYDQAVRVMSFNIRSDDNLQPDENSILKWADRKKRVASMIRFHRADLIGLQEPCRTQLDDLKKELLEYRCFDGVEIGTVHDSIFFRKSRFDLIDSGTFFLSQTPEIPSIGWDAKFVRAASWVKLLDKKTKKQFYFFNTHFDYHSRTARDESARLLRKQVAALAGRSPFVVTGDFNFFPALGGKETYDLLIGPSDTRAFVDAQTVALFPHHGPTGTWSGFKEPGQPGIKPDCIFVAPEVEVYLHGVLSDTFDGQFPSDHLPVVSDIRIK